MLIFRLIGKDRNVEVGELVYLLIVVIEVGCGY